MSNEVTVTVERTQLLGILQVNQKKHVEEFQEALEGYNEKLKADLDKLVADLSYGRDIQENLRKTAYMPRPSSHANEYARVIRMLEMHRKETLELTEDQFKNYVDDDWKWSTEFKSISSSYAR